MPTLTRDWREQARILISAGMGVRQTARKLGLPEERVKKWATRAKVCQTIAIAQAAVAQAVSPRSPSVPMAADILAAMPTNVLTLSEKRAFLRSVVATPVGEVDEHSILSQRVKRTVNKLGHTETEVWLPDKLRALEIDAKLAGELSDRADRGPLVSLNFVATQAAAEQVTIDLPSVEQSGPTE